MNIIPPKTLTEWLVACHNYSRMNGWWREGDADDPIIMASKIALIHSEVSEMLEGLRKGKADDHLPEYPAEWVEAADIFIRLMDYCGARGIPLEKIVPLKLEYNKTRADHQPEARAAAGGKAF